MTVIGDPSLVLDSVGAIAAAVVRRLVLSLPEVAVVSFATYRHLPMVEDRFSPTEGEQDVIAEALELRLELGLPFWDCVMLAAAKSSADLRGLLSEATTHVSMRGRDIHLDRKQIADGEIDDLCAVAAREGAELSVLSEVALADGTVRHLALMDLHARPESSAFSTITEVCRQIFPGGSVLLESGESYHMYGLSLLPRDGLSAFLGKALLFAPIIDRAYIAHQLIEGRCALRVSGGDGPSEKPVPRAIAVV